MKNVIITLNFESLPFFLNFKNFVSYKNRSRFFILWKSFKLYEGYIRHDGKAVVKLSKSIPLTTIAGRPLVLDLTPEFSYKDQFDWDFESEVSYNYTERISFGINYRKDKDGNDSVGFGIKIRF